jgi:hypothetical protein
MKLKMEAADLYVWNDEWINQKKNGWQLRVFAGVVK